MREYALEMTTTEIKPITIPVEDLQEGESLDDAAITHIPPSGDALEFDHTIDDTNINFLLGPLELTGNHLVKVQAEGDQGSKPEVLFSILVKV